MLAYNNVVIIGNLSRDPDVKTVGKAGMKLVRLSVCINEKRKTQDGKVVDNPVFVDVEAWSRLADICEKYLVKNSVIFVEGRLQMAQWEKDGVKHQKLKVRAQNIKFLSKTVKTKTGDKNEMKKNPPETEVFVPDAVNEQGAENEFDEDFCRW